MNKLLVFSALSHLASLACFYFAVTQTNQPGVAHAPSILGPVSIVLCLLGIILATEAGSEKQRDRANGLDR